MDGGVNARRTNQLRHGERGPKKGKALGELLIDSDLIEGETCPKGGLLGGYERKIL
jgi:hypothetical protein